MGSVTTQDVIYQSQVPRYKIFEHPADRNARLLAERAVKADGRRIGFIEDVLDMRTHALKTGNTSVIDQTCNRWMDVGTWVAYWANQVKIFPYEMPEKSELLNGALALTEEQFNNLPNAITYPRADIKTDTWFTKAEVLEIPLWQKVGGKKLAPYVDAAFKHYNYETAMAIFLAKEESKPTARPLVLNGGNYWWSDLVGNWDLVGDARLVGVRDDVSLAEAVQKSLRKRK